MASQPETPNLSRRRMLTAATLLPAAAAIGALGTASAAEAAPGGAYTVTRSQVMERALYWHDRDIQYSMTDYHRDPDSANHEYRTDCSGYVSMCWHTYLGSNGGYSTETIPGIAREIRWRDLKPGDVVNWPNPNGAGHVRLFDSWSITPSMMWIYELTVDGMTTRHRPLDADIMQNQGYIPRRYGNIID